MTFGQARAGRIQRGIAAIHVEQEAMASEGGDRVPSHDLAGVVDAICPRTDRVERIERGIAAIDVQQEPVADAGDKALAHDLASVVNPVREGRGRAGRVERGVVVLGLRRARKGDEQTANQRAVDKSCHGKSPSQLVGRETGRMALPATQFGVARKPWLPPNALAYSPTIWPARLIAKALVKFESGGSSVV